MKRLCAVLSFILIAGCFIAYPHRSSASLKRAIKPEDAYQTMKKIIPKYLGKPYKWGKAGPRRFDCSGFVWRVLYESGIRIKRTSTRKLYLRLPKTAQEDQQTFGTIVFFRNLKHCGIINDQETFYHASVKEGTTLSSFTPYWSSRICGYRSIPKKLL